MPDLNEEISTFLASRGAGLAGFADLRKLDTGATDNLPFGVLIAVPLDPTALSGIKIGPTPEYRAEYKRVNQLLDELAQQLVLYLIKKGYKAKMRPATFEEDKAHLTAKLPHKTVATRAGSGWIGKSALLITREYGPAVRLATVLTDAPVKPGKAIDKSLCGHCRHCVDACPAHAITGKNWEAGMPRDSLYDAFTCREMTRNLSQKLIGEAISICGLCITSCPWTQKYLKKNNNQGTNPN